VLELNENNKKTFLVTGGAGFLGSHLVERLLAEGNKVICFDNEFRGTFQNLSHIKTKELIMHKGDVRKPEDWPSKYGTIDGLFHLAAINGTHYFYSIPEEVLDVNVKGTINALEFTRKNDIGYFSFASTPEAYGIPETFPTPETEKLTVPDLDNPRWSYGSSKIIGEVYSVNFAKKFGFKCSILRFHNTYGPRDFEGHVIPDLIKQIISKNKIIEIEGTGKETRSFCFIDDTIDATILVKNKQKSMIDVFNIGIDNETEIIELIKMLEEIVERKVNFQFKAKDKPGTNRRVPDITKIKKIGFNPKTDLKKGLKLTYQWHVKNLLNN